MVRRWELVAFEPGEQPAALTEVACTKGTYVRSLAGLLGERLSTGAFLSFLVRTRVGPHELESAWTLETLARMTRAQAERDALLSPLAMLAHMPRIQVASEAAERLRHGHVHTVPTVADNAGTVAVVTDPEVLVCIAQATAREGQLRLEPRQVFDWDD